MNMSYCRFQNTVTDFRACMGALEEMDSREAGNVLSREEMAAAKELAAMALTMVEMLADVLDKSAGDLDAIIVGKAIDRIQASAVRADKEQEEVNA